MSEIRPVTFADRKYIIQSWLYDYQESPAMKFPGIINDDYFGYEHDKIAKILTASTQAGAAYLAHEPGKPHLFRGYLIAQPFENLPVVHFLKVKQGSKQQGVATELLHRFYSDFSYEKGQNVVYTYGTKDMRKPWLQRSMKGWSAIFLPWLLEELEWQD
jgi:hypothetical protein